MNRLLILLLLLAAFGFVKSVLDINSLEQQAQIAGLQPPTEDMANASASLSVVSPQMLYADMGSLVGLSDPYRAL